MDKDKQKFLIRELRRASYKWPARNEAFKKARVSRGNYRCAMCFSVNFKRQEIAADHIFPVVDPVNGWTTLDEYADRMLCDESGWQILCKPCHNKKTKEENALRGSKRH